MICEELKHREECAQLHFDVGFVNMEMTQVWEFVEECITFCIRMGESCKKD